MKSISEAKPHLAKGIAWPSNSSYSFSTSRIVVIRFRELIKPRITDTAPWASSLSSAAITFLAIAVFLTEFEAIDIFQSNAIRNV